MAVKRNLISQLLLHVTVGFVLLYTKDLQVKAQSELPTTPSQQPLSSDMTTASTVTTLPPPPPTTAPPPPLSSGKFISFSSICHSDITLEVRTVVPFDFHIHSVTFISISDHFVRLKDLSDDEAS
jgi:hypothetical protein